MTSMLDQTPYEAACAAVDAECGANAHLIEHGPVVDEHLFFAATDPVPTPDFAYTHGPGDRQTEPVVVAPRNFLSTEREEPRYLHEPPAPERRAACDLCDQTFGSGAPHPSHWNRADGTRHIFWVPAGARAVEFVVCSLCRADLDKNFAPVAWR